MSHAPTERANLGVAPAPPRASGAAPAERRELRPHGLKRLRGRRRENHEVRTRGLDDPREFLDRGVRAQVVDAPAAAIEHDAEDHEREVVQFAGRAGEHGTRPVPAPPTPREPGEPAADDIAGEVLLTDAGRPARPTVAEIGEVRHDDIAQGGAQRQVGQQAVEHGLRGRLVERIEGLAQRGHEFVNRRRGDRWLGGTFVRAEHGARCLRGGQPVGQVRLHTPHPHLVRFGVEPIPAR